MADQPITVVELPAYMRHDPMRREVNHGLFVRWVQEDPLARASADARSSVGLYDSTGMFIFAVPTLPDDATLSRLFASTPVRYYSRGIV